MGDKKAFLLRIPNDLWEELNRFANDELRSVNAQVEYILREALRRRRRMKEAASLKDILFGGAGGEGEPGAPGAADSSGGPGGRKTSGGPDTSASPDPGVARPDAEGLGEE